MNRMVMLVTWSGDVSGIVPAMQELLEARGVRALRFDTDAFPTEQQVRFVHDGATEALQVRDGEVWRTLAPDDAIWYRRARWAGKLPATMDRQLRHGCTVESEAFLRGVMAAAPCFVMDPPEAVRENGHKPYQLSLARRLGLATPRTLATNDPAAAHAFIRACPHGAVAKMLSAFPVYDEQGEEQVVFTTALAEDHLGKLEGLRYAPMVFQERLQKALELRVTVVGRRIFAAAVDSQRQPGAEVDWRERGVSLLRSWVPYDLPAETERRLSEYMERIGMQYSAIDMVVEPDGRHVFLEANPAGECYWLQYNSPHFPLAQALVDVLVDEPGARRASRRVG
ncbi:MvdC/MvdD family ATP grasp protein [Nannocystis punicea]|uniref:MvdD family ATP-grasp ribosomal peptide maturase n=1 Tax=Nannocystis punicea TaxID=2995304 RepID=A0ABY7H591_9BACT|nr:MvdD family ATP-grasp ribosomal peptide maturase [Nannocystis poenicansa]WAS94189.1 MvdD family ATP-grasp ribosomal peptide maturase [Nannocystis poenicansa]